jgi:hypothetical protein
VLRRLWMLVPGVLLTAAACARGGGEEEPRPIDSPVRVEITNNHALPIEVEAAGSGARQRLGTVHPGMAGHFVVPQNLMGAGGVELFAHPAASREQFSSGPLLLAPGTIVDFVIAPQLFNSTATLRQ